MSTTELKKKIHKYVDSNGLHTLLINKTKQEEYSPELIAMLEEREARYTRGESKLYDWDEVYEKLHKKFASR